MKILYDHQIFTQQKFGGISRVFYEVINSSNDNEDIFKNEVSIVFNNNYYLSQLKDIKLYNLKRNFKGKHKFEKFVNKLNSIKNIKRSSFDIFHPTYYDTYFLKYLSKPFVLTVHDMIHEKYIIEDTKTINNKKTLIEKANKIIAISKHTKKDIVNTYNIEPNKIEVVYWANSLIKLKRITCPNRYVLFVGNRYTYKNFITFAEAIQPLLINDKELFLVCAGGGRFTQDEISRLRELNINDKVVQITVEDCELSYLYKNAEAFIYPSLYEGFGIPILEAFSWQCPVVLSNSSCFPEIAEEAAEYFDPFNKEDIMLKIQKVIYDNNYRNKLIKLGELRNKDFTWEKTVKEYDRIYRG